MLTTLGLDLLPAEVIAFVIFVSLVTIAVATEVFHLADRIDDRYAPFYMTAVVLAIGATYISGVLAGTVGF